MSDQEQDEVILRVVKEAREARHELSLLRVKVHSVCGDLEAVLNFLRSAVGPDVVRGDRSSVDLSISFHRLPSGPEIRELSYKLKAATERDSDLSQKKQQLGI